MCERYENKEVVEKDGGDEQKRKQRHEASVENPRGRWREEAHITTHPSVCQGESFKVGEAK